MLHRDMSGLNNSKPYQHWINVIIIQTDILIKIISSARKMAIFGRNKKNHVVLVVKKKTFRVLRTSQ